MSHAALSDLPKIGIEPAAGISSIASEFASVQRSLKSINRRWTRSRQRKKRKADEKFYERDVGKLLDRMQSLSFKASQTNSRNLGELQVKALIWLERHIPDDEDDVTALASSICNEIIALYRSNVR